MPKILKSLVNAVVNPTVRLRSDFPWTFREVFKLAVGAEFYFLFPGLVISLGWLIVSFGALFAELAWDVPLYTTWIKPLYWTDTAHAPVLGMPGSGNIKIGFVIGMIVLSTGAGFISELWYVFSCMSARGINWRKTFGLNLDGLSGSLTAAVWRAVVAVALIFSLDILLQSLLPAPVDIVGKLMKEVTGMSFLAMAFIAVVVAPLLEEIIFRGFLFNALRSAFRGRQNTPEGSQPWADFAAIFLSAAIFGGVHMINAFIDARYLWCLPSMIVCGMVLAELYRRTGSLIPGILVHLLNNGLIILLMACEA
jgi:membrane protease YdiL (CAAX protease family)